MAYHRVDMNRAGIIAAGNLRSMPDGIDIDIPTAAGHSKCTPAGTKGAVMAAFRGGADGVILSRKYSEMKLENLRSAGDALKEINLA
jgi:hypothetical protein